MSGVFVDCLDKVFKAMIMIFSGVPISSRVAGRSQNTSDAILHLASACNDRPRIFTSWAVFLDGLHRIWNQLRTRGRFLVA